MDLLLGTSRIISTEVSVLGEETFDDIFYKVLVLSTEPQVVCLVVGLP